MSKKNKNIPKEISSFFNQHRLNKTQAVAIANSDKVKGFNPAKQREIKTAMSNAGILKAIRKL